MSDHPRLPIGLFVSALVFSGMARPALAHKGHEHASPSPSPSAVASGAPGSSAAPAASGTPSAATPSPAAAPVSVDWKSAAFSHPHNKLVHFPIAFGMAAAVIMIVSPRWPQYEAAGRALLLVAALFTIAAYFTGDAQKEDFRGSALWDTAELHENLGIATAITLWAGVVLGRIPALRSWLWVYAVVLFVLIGATGFLGGVLAHTEM